MRTVKGYKFLTETLRSSNGDSGEWKLGEWKKHLGELEMCKSGFHGSPTPLTSLQYVYGPRWFRVEAKGRILHDSDKFTASEMRIVKELPTKRIAVRFAIACARRALGRFEEKSPEDDRPRKAIEAAEAYLQNPSPETASAAWSAASAARSAEEKWQSKTLQKIVDEELEQ